LKAWDEFYASEEVDRRSKTWLSSLRARHDIVIDEDILAATAAELQAPRP